MFGLLAIFVNVIGVPAIGATGLIVSFLTRNSKRPEFYSMIGYASAALIVCGFLFMGTETGQRISDFFWHSVDSFIL